MAFKSIDKRWKMSATDTHVYFVGGPFSQWFTAVMLGPLPFLDDVDPDTPITLIDRSGTPRTTPIQSVGGHRHFTCCEQYMMAGKAMLFRDFDVLGQILSASSPKDMKALGRKVKGFDKDAWDAVSRDVVTAGNVLKFGQNDKLREFLFATGDKTLVEGAWYDEVWGVKLAWDDPRILDEANWQGKNWLGECLMRVRTVLYADLLLKIHPGHQV